MRQIRPATHSDIAQLFNLYHREGWASFSEDKIAELLEKSVYLVVTEDDKIIAFARYLTDGLMTTFLAEIMVSPACRGQGLGRWLIEDIQDQTSGTRIELISEVDGFYEQLGFRKVGQGYRKI